MKRILIVDDEPEIRELLKKKLEQAGYKAKTASGGQEALILSKNTKPDLILLDIAMPEMDGYQTCEELKKDSHTQAIPVLFLTAKDLEPKAAIEAYKNLGACGYIPKPSSIKDLLEKIKEIIG